MKGTQAICAQGIVYEENKEFACLPPTEITTHGNPLKVSPTALSGNSMKLRTVENLRGRGLWFLVLGSSAATLGDNGLFAEVTHAYLGYTLFLENEDEYVAFLHFMSDKSPRELYAHIPTFLAGREGVRHMLGK